MEVKNAIEKRRSVRKYKNRELSDFIINELIEAARLAPSAYNAQPTKLIILKSKEIKRKLEEDKIFKQSFVCEAPVIIVFLGDPNVYPKGRLEATYSNPSEIAGDVGAVRDVSIAAQNLVLRAMDLGLGTCYIGLIAREKFKHLLNLPEDYVLPFAIIAGYPDEKPKASPRKPSKDLLMEHHLNLC